jgi:hypothetical protein
MLKSFIKLLLLLCCAMPVSATTSFVDFSSGADTNAGTKLSPFKNAPGMNGCANNCLAAQAALTAGSQVILKGNVVWPNPSLGILISASGSSGNPIYYGVDVTWFNNMTGTANTSGTSVTWITGVHGPGIGCNVNCNLFGDFTKSLIGATITVNGGSCTVATVTDATHLTCTVSQGTHSGIAFSIPAWGRPIFDAQNIVMGSNAGLANVMLRPYGNFITLDSIELRGLFWSGTPGPGQASYIEFAGGTPGKGNGNDLKNLFIHGWSHDVRSAPTCTTEANLILGDSAVPNLNVGSALHDSIVTGQDTDYSAGTSGAATFGGPPIQYRNLYEHVSDGGVVNGVTTLHDITADTIGPTFQVFNGACPSQSQGVAHTNGFELNAQSTDVTLYNLVIRHMGTGTLSLWCGTNSGVNCYAFNNVIYDTDIGNILDPAQSVMNNGCPAGPTYCNVAGNFFYVNNTVECGPDAGPPSAGCQGPNGAITSIKHQNGFYITSGTIFQAPPTATLVTNLGSGNNGVPLATACGTNFYCANQAFAFSPTSPSGITVGRGTSNSSFCATINALDSTAGFACLKDTTYGVAVDKTSWTVTGLARTALTRSASTPSIGAYEFTGGGGGSVFISPTTFSYGTVTIVASSNSSALVLTNSSGSTITFTGTTYTGVNAGDWTSFSSTCTGSLATAGTCTVVAKFSPTAVAGTHETATLNVAYSGFAGGPQTVALDGTAGAPVIVTPPAPAPQIFTGKLTVLPLPAVPPAPIIASSSPAKSYLTTKGFSQDGLTFTTALPLTLAGSNFAGTPTCSIDGTAVPCACGSASSCVLQIPMLTMPSASTDHVWSISFPGAPAPPVVN